jgi:hypothetical protein
MQFQGQQLISHATLVSSRTLVTLAFAKIFSIWYGVNTSDLEVLGVKFGDAFVSAAPILIAFLAVNHFLNWLGDLNSFQGWNTSEKITPDDVWSIGSGASLPSKLESAIGRNLSFKHSLSQVQEKLENYKAITDEKARSHSFEGLEASIERIKELCEANNVELTKLSARISHINFQAKLYLWGWFFVMPFGLSGYAVFLWAVEHWEIT